MPIFGQICQFWWSTKQPRRTKIQVNFLFFFFFFFYPSPLSQDVVDKKWDENAGRPDGSPVDKELGREGNVTVDVERGEANV